jgi:hypothetical protein
MKTSGYSTLTPPRLPLGEGVSALTLQAQFPGPLLFALDRLYLVLSPAAVEAL